MVWAITDGTALNTSTTRTSLLPAHAKWTAPANYFNFQGKVMRVTAKGRLSNIVTTPGTLTLDIGIGATNLFTSGAISLNTTAKTNTTFWLEVEMVLRTLGNGAASNFMAIGQLTSESLLGSAANTFATTYNLPGTAPAVGGNFDAATANIWDLFGTFSVSNAANSIQVHTFKIEALN